MSDNSSARKAVVGLLIFVCIAAAAIVAAIWLLPSQQVTLSVEATSTPVEASTTPSVFAVTHVSTPAAVHAVYFTSWAAGTPSFQKQMFALFAASSTRLNSIVIDIKDYSGRISFAVTDPTLAAMGSAENRIPDIEHFIDSLHKKGIYTIGRVQAFEDPFAVAVHPEWAVKTASGAVWKDSGGAKWIDPDNKTAWNYVAAIAKEGYKVGFDEINFDYVRFPSDGVGNAVFAKRATTTKESVITSFFSYLHDELAPSGIPISADVFGQTTTDLGDMGIGQHFENVLPYFDFVDPMIYPSHYINGFDGFPKPAEHPYEIVHHAMASSSARAIAASSTPEKIRPWLQAFDLGATYTPAFVEDQIQATADAGLGGWLLWNAGAVYTRYADLLSSPEPVIATLATSSVSTSTAVH